MGWFVAVDRRNHPCFLPDSLQKQRHRSLEFWRCEVCDDLFQLQRGEFQRITDWWLRWRYRKEGYTRDPVS